MSRRGSLLFWGMVLLVVVPSALHVPWSVESRFSGQVMTDFWLIWDSPRDTLDFVNPRITYTSLFGQWVFTGFGVLVAWVLARFIVRDYRKYRGAVRVLRI